MLLILEYYIEVLPVLLLLYFVPHIVKTINSRDTMMSDRCNHLVYLLRQVGWQLALRYSANEKMSICLFVCLFVYCLSVCLSVCLLLRVLCTSDLQRRLSFMIFPTDIALDFIIYRINVVFTGSSAKYCTIFYTLWYWLLQ